MPLHERHSAAVGFLRDGGSDGGARASLLEVSRCGRRMFGLRRRAQRGRRPLRARQPSPRALRRRTTAPRHERHPRAREHPHAHVSAVGARRARPSPRDAQRPTRVENRKASSREGRSREEALRLWAQRDLNPRLQPCEGRTLPLSYAPSLRVTNSPAPTGFQGRRQRSSRALFLLVPAGCAPASAPGAVGDADVLPPSQG